MQILGGQVLPLQCHEFCVLRISGSSNSKCLGLTGDCCPTPNGRMLDCCEGSEAPPKNIWLEAFGSKPGRSLPKNPGKAVVHPETQTSLPLTPGLGPACEKYLQAEDVVLEQANG